MKARDRFIEFYGRDVPQEDVVVDTDEIFMWKFKNKHGEEVVGGFQPCEFKFWRNSEPELSSRP